MFIFLELSAFSLVLMQVNILFQEKINLRKFFELTLIWNPSLFKAN